MSQASASKPASAPVRTPAEIEADLDATRERLVGTITELEDRVNPTKVAKRGSNKVKDFYVGPDGVRWKNVALTAGVVVGGLVAEKPLRLVKNATGGFVIHRTKWSATL